MLERSESTIKKLVLMVDIIFIASFDPCTGISNGIGCVHCSEKNLERGNLRCMHAFRMNDSNLDSGCLSTCFWWGGFIPSSILRS